MLKRIVFLSSIIYYLLSSAGVAQAATPHLQLLPTTGNLQGTFEIDVRIDTSGEAVGGADVILLFPKNLLKAEGFTKGTAFPEVLSFPKNEEGKWRLAAYFPLDKAGEFFEGANGLIGKFKFTATASGTAAVNFLCEPGKPNDTNIVSKTTSTDIILCSANVGASYQVTPGTGTAASPTPTPTATPIASSSPYPSPSTLPETAGTGYTLGILGAAIITILTGLVLIF